MSNEPTLDLTVADVEFIVEELPPNDEFTKELRDWLEEQYRRKAALASQEVTE